MARIWTVTERILQAVMVLFLSAMASITAIDVAGRYLFGIPLAGGYEIVQYLMALVVFAALPLATRAEAHLTIDLFANQVPQRLRAPHRAIVLGFSALALALIAWRMTAQAGVMTRSEAVSGSLGFPLAPIAYAMAALGWFSLLICLTLLVLVVLGKDTGPTENAHLEEIE
ncbi:TRAP transporter small permease [Paracoccus albus]|uniref:TRAP transporter small permease n=1 Tax=Paracoccus albus TaxID=3017784 RepID=UPI0022F06DDD|nr:TRAP transporter small permease [Paracoccus albus]WBU59280.1 TRAP transporter small permease [Paracoccus albus]